VHEQQAHCRAAWFVVDNGEGRQRILDQPDDGSIDADATPG
jgi:hypothetical protein